MSTDIKTHYTLEDTIVTKSEGGSSVEINFRDDNAAELKIFVSANRSTRECALVADFPEQLVKALELEQADLPDLPRLLQVPRTSLKALLIRRGIIGGDTDTGDDYEETLVEHGVNRAFQTGSKDRSSSSSSNALSDVEELVNSESIRASARSETTNKTLRTNLHYGSGSSPITPRSISHGYPDISSDETPHQQPVTSHLAALYSTENRNQNRERLQDFARNLGSGPSTQLGGSTDHSNAGSGGGFDMSALREALQDAEPAAVLTPVHISFGMRRRGGPISNRNAEERARDFEVGFLGEQFVGLLENLALFNLPRPEG